MTEDPEHLTPKIIHQIVGPKTTPLIHKCLRSWLPLKRKGFEIITWNDSSLAEFISANHLFAYEAFANSRNHAEAADIARYLLIYSYGGYYVDWDIELLNQELLFELNNKYPRGYMLRDPLNNTLASEYFCAIPNDKYLLNLTEDIVQLYESDSRNMLFTPSYSGPFRMRDSLIKHPETVMTSIPVKEAFAYDYEEIRNIPHRQVTQPMVHYWVHSWIK